MAVDSMFQPLSELGINAFKAIERVEMGYKTKGINTFEAIIAQGGEEIKDKGNISDRMNSGCNVNKLFMKASAL